MITGTQAASGDYWPGSDGMTSCLSRRAFSISSLRALCGVQYISAYIGITGANKPQPQSLYSWVSRTP
jgi:hypothetical protein